LVSREHGAIYVPVLLAGNISCQGWIEISGCVQEVGRNGFSSKISSLILLFYHVP
jgi:hypothetical protein